MLEVRTITPRFEEKSRVSQGTGTYAASDHLVVKAPTRGSIARVLVGEGDHVLTDDTLLEFSSTETGNQIARKQEQIREAQNLLDSMNRALTSPPPTSQGEGSVFLDEEEAKPVMPKVMGTMEAQIPANPEDLANKIRTTEGNLDALTRELTLLEEGLKNLSVKAGISGTVIKRHVTDGSVVEQGEALFEIVTLDPITLSFFVSQDVSSYVDKGVKVEGAPTDAPELVSEGVVYYVSPALDPVKRMLELKAHFPNPQGLIKAGQEGRAKVATRKTDQVWAIPKRALLSEDSKSYIYVITGSQARRANVKVLNDIDVDYVAADANLRIDDAIIISNPEALKDGDFVKPISDLPAISPGA